jgi:hypothetical protein
MILNNLSLQLKVQVKPGSPSVELNSAVKKNLVMAKLYKVKPEARDLSEFDVEPGERMVIYSAHTCTQKAEPHYRH